jgi:hypothetical protein
MFAAGHIQRTERERGVRTPGAGPGVCREASSGGAASELIPPAVTLLVWSGRCLGR